MLSASLNKTFPSFLPTSKTHEKMENSPTDSNITEHNKFQAVSKKEKLKQIRESWKKKIESLNLDKDSTKLWKLTKSLNEESHTTHRGCTVIDENGKTYKGKHDANVLADGFATDSKITIWRDRQAEVRKEIKKETSCRNPSTGHHH